MDKLLRTVKMTVSKGSNAGRAIYLEDESGGTRIAGPKCWGFINNEEEFTLDERDLDSLIETAKNYKRVIKNDKKKWLKKLDKELDKLDLELVKEDIESDYIIGRYYTLGYSIDKTVELMLKDSEEE